MKNAPNPNEVISLVRLEDCMRKSVSAAGAIRWRRREQGFRRLPKGLRTLLGGRHTMLFLTITADIAHETYLNEASTWPLTRQL